MSSITLNELERVESLCKQQKQKSVVLNLKLNQVQELQKSFSTKDSKKKSAHTESGGKTQTERSKSNKTHHYYGDKKQKM